MPVLILCMMTFRAVEVECPCESLGAQPGADVPGVEAGGVSR